MTKNSTPLPKVPTPTDFLAPTETLAVPVDEGTPPTENRPPIVDGPRSADLLPPAEVIAAFRAIRDELNPEYHEGYGDGFEMGWLAAVDDLERRMRAFELERERQRIRAFQLICEERPIVEGEHGPQLPILILSRAS